MSDNPLSPLYLNPVVQFQQLQADAQEVSHGSIGKVLIIYTGGTLGMKRVENEGYLPVDDYLSQVMQSTSRFCDPSYGVEYAEVQSISGTVKQPVLTTPLSLYKRRIKYSILSYRPLLDSANMSMTDWSKIANDIQLNYQPYDAFVIIHGTDTMAYTASALSFMLEDLGKTIILTGSQVPLSEWRTDAEENLLGALLIAGHFVIPEVCLYFNNKLFRGNRCSKIDAIGFSAFDSSNIKPLATLGVNIDVNWQDVRRPHSIQRFRAHIGVCSEVSVIRFYPSIPSQVIELMLQPPIKGAVLETYGAGNVPSDRVDVLKLLKDACDRGVVIVSITQCMKGNVSGTYKTGKVLQDIGVVPGSDMTTECALSKLSYLLSKNKSVEDVRRLMAVSLRGELTTLPYQDFAQSQKFALKNSPFITGVMQAMQMESAQERKQIEKALVPHLVCASAGLGDIEAFGKLQEVTADPTLIINSQDFDKRTALHIAAMNGHFEVVQRLVQLGASVHLRDADGESPLQLACKNNHRQVADLLLKCGAFLDTTSQQVAYAFFRSIEAGNVSQVQLYLNCGMKTNVKLFGLDPLLYTKSLPLKSDIKNKMVDMLQ